MKKRTKWMVVALVAGMLMAAGCEKHSILEGTIVDAKDRPISGLRVIADMVQPVKGYEHFETKTDPGGRFSFKTFYPSSDYLISVQHKNWRSDAVAHVTAGPEGRMVKLEKPIQILFGVSDDGVITDFITGLEWMAGPDDDTTWDAAKAWCSNLSVAGGGWRMPNRAELKALYDNGFGKKRLASIFKTTVWGVWSGEQFESSKAGQFRFQGGIEGWTTRSPEISSYGRAMAVRSPK